MHRRDFIRNAALAGAAATLPRAGSAQTASTSPPANRTAVSPLTPFALGLLIVPHPDPEEHIRRVHDLGFNNCFLSLDSYLGGGLTPALATRFRSLLDRYQVRVTTVEVVGPKPLEWNFLRGPATIGLVPRATRAARIDALRQASDFGHELGVEQVQTHCGFIPEDPADPLYAETVTAISAVARHCAGNGQQFLMETGQETPTTMARVLHDVGQPNLAVGLDTANLILYGKANPVDAVAILGPHVRSIHAKDGRWPTDPSQLGEEVLIGQGLVDFAKVFQGLKRAGYTGAVTIERETNGPQQIADVREEKQYLEKVLSSLA